QQTRAYGEEAQQGRRQRSFRATWARSGRASLCLHSYLVTVSAALWPRRGRGREGSQDEIRPARPCIKRAGGTAGGPAPPGPPPRVIDRRVAPSSASHTASSYRGWVTELIPTESVREVANTRL